MRIVSVDQSLARPGLAVVEADSVQKVLEAFSLKHERKATPSQRRIDLVLAVEHLVEKYRPDCVIVERVRTFSKGYLSTRSIITLGSLVAGIIDGLSESGLAVYSVDTRAWKSHVLGSPSATKADAVEFCLTQFGLDLDHDASDAVCMGLYALQPGAKLKKEE